MLNQKKMLFIILGLAVLISVISYVLIVKDRGEYVEQTCEKAGYLYTGNMSCQQVNCVVECCNDRVMTDCVAVPVT